MGHGVGTREALVEHLWQAVINPLREPARLQNVVDNCRRAPDSGFGAAGPAIERMLAAGVSPQDLCTVLHLTAYEAVFGTLYALGDPGVDDDNVFGLYEDMATSPSADFGPA
ncbi:hypothetical protein [Lysobacter solisilvae (ex Woo and Kim 2020)]|uniref:Uncharacterized protein n=1 Tax=Agrilutibacter terrestris TaxID=2865112 RepID=A0A7H0FUK4_9GAMM|nr:hypothetical protein [Lysobacter terrestris]QNP39720.1 hypothetical protein H8B22_09345 [Lysobacter terrestris]